MKKNALKTRFVYQSDNLLLLLNATLIPSIGDLSARTCVMRYCNAQIRGTYYYKAESERQSREAILDMLPLAGLSLPCKGDKVQATAHESL